MRAQLLHLSGPERGRTATYAGPVVHIGTDDANEARVVAPAVARRHARIEWRQNDCHFHLRRLDGQVFVNGHEVEEVILESGDELELGAGGPRVRFRCHGDDGEPCKPVRRMLADADGATIVKSRKLGPRAFTHDVLKYGALRLKIGLPLAIVAGAFLAGWLGGWIGGRPAKGPLKTADSVTQTELADLREQAEEQQTKLQELVAANASVRRVQKEWSRGVCLVHGIFRLRMPDGSWYQRGFEPYEREYTGSGFLVTAEGHIVTNRHVALPWLREHDLNAVIEQGAVPEFTRLTVTFPGRAPIAVQQSGIRRRDDDLDVALLQADAAKVDGVPVLPLHRGEIDADDQRAIVVGYPLGLGALLARADARLVEALRQRSATYTESIDELAATNQVLPLITQGIVSEARDDRIVYDALTTSGGSGGPVFGAGGDVIAVNAAIMQNYPGANFGIPIRFAEELLPR